ncbi:hypothetical protein DFA_07641 [Cavenderia fasciculata]|uniref:Uncharacterized protein n=1 Tax=Cavenderia fasciculata TaxID=261658 RepID=F4Q2I4_CACFS|nr:uncharacterized protein DFA_07641 [Cavenderia fasciculata]EGG16663.1 hypothetical protein DFA_07641 [Cavenderia fasciculata]|eukprot:XP_004355137.1 hypothetical protein DFA_07641 [Cavenderia fasciculata]
MTTKSTIIALKRRRPSTNQNTITMNLLLKTFSPRADYRDIQESGWLEPVVRWSVAWWMNCTYMSDLGEKP